ncbi:MAG: helix-turn-helix transcriptional regulator [Bacteroidales bacterium]
MEKPETLEDFYSRKFPGQPNDIYNGPGHFNIFRLDPTSIARPVPYKKRDYYKITFCKGKSKVHYADSVSEIEKQAIVFSNPLIPYRWEHIGGIEGGFFCIFNQAFFSRFGNLENYDVFIPGGIHVFELDDIQGELVSAIYEKMWAELISDYVHKYDSLRAMAFELIHFAMKMQPSSSGMKKHGNASSRITSLFIELLERQFPVDESHQRMNLRSASEFAGQLAVHVNHLNRAIKQVTGKTTTRLISERILEESKSLLVNSDWNVSDIASALKFREVTHFNNFFKKNTGVSPLKYRNR